ncbi:hypothetical protein NFI96_021515 [Prochilodus magdalenae]|nr:hypothetical protein NFI96_021515 [Prochilodus magdalenae]
MVLTPIWALMTTLYRTAPVQAVDLHQKPSFVSAELGEAVTLHCTLEESTSNERMVWYKQKPGQAPQQVGIILTNADPLVLSGFKDKDIKLEANRSGTSLSIPHTTKDDEGTYYCGVSQVNMITFSTGTFLALTVRPVDPVVMCLGAALGMCVFVISAQAILLCKIKSDHSSVRVQQDSGGGNLTRQDSATVELLYAAKSLRMKSGRSADSVYSEDLSAGKWFSSVLPERHEAPVQAVDLHQKPSFVSAVLGEAVTLHCTFEENTSNERMVWYRQKRGQAPQQVGIILTNADPLVLSGFKDKDIKLEANRSSTSLSIPYTTKDDEGTYYCGVSQVNMITFSTGTFLALTGQTEFNISVLQTPSQGSVSPGESVTLQCTVLSEIRAADLRVLWFRAAAGQSFPEIIYTHQNSSSRQCEISSSTHSSVYNFSRNILNHHHTGTYYCAVAACGGIIFGNGTAVELAQPLDPVVICLGAALGVCVVVISVQTILNRKRRNCEHCRAEKRQQGSVKEKTTRQGGDAEELNYAALHFHERKTKRGREKRVQTQEDTLYSAVRSSTVNDRSAVVVVVVAEVVPDPAQAVDVSAASFVSVESGQNVTLLCKEVEGSDHSSKIWVWYKQRTGQEPQEVAMKLGSKAPGTSSTRFKIVQSFNLTIEQAIKDDEGMYFCAVGEGNAISFSKGTFLVVAGQPQLNISVLQTPAWGSVTPGESVTLQCTVLSDLKAAGLPVLWFRDTAGQSFPEVIYTHQKTGSHQCEFSSSTNSCMYNFSISNFSQSDAGTYYCAVAACGRIIVGNGASVTLGRPVDPIVFYLATALGICVTVICGLAIQICSGQLDISVLQTPVEGPVSPGEPVTLQCTVLSEIRAADLRVLWFRAAAGQSFPEIIYTHQNSSSRQCEISSSTHSSVYNFSRNILNHHHTGTYYCAVAACEKIIFGNGTAVGLNEAPVDPVTMTLAVFSAVCVAVICAQTIFIYKMRRSEHRAGEGVQERGVNERTTRQEQKTENLNYAAINIQERTPKSGRVKKDQPGDTVYSHARSSKAAAHRSHR